jgi:hypothetical protein
VTCVPFDNDIDIDVERASAETFDAREPQNDDAEDGAPGHPAADDVYIDDRRLAKMLGCSRVTLQPCPLTRAPVARIEARSAT